MAHMKEQINLRFQQQMRQEDWLDRRLPNWRQEFYGPGGFTPEEWKRIKELEKQLVVEGRDNDEPDEEKFRDD